MRETCLDINENNHSPIVKPIDNGMKNALRSFLLFLIVLLSHFTWTASAETNNSYCTGDDQFLIEQPDTLMIGKAEGKREYTVVSGDELVVHYQGNHLKGFFHAMSDGTLEMLVNEQITPISVSEITAIRLINPPLNRAFGIPLMVLGVSGMGLGAISLVAGLIGVATGSIGAIVLLAVIPLGGVGYGVFALGQSLTGKRLRIAEGHYALLQAVH
jgi:hypothetical protein